MSIETFYTAQTSQNSAAGGRIQANSAAKSGAQAGNLPNSELGFFNMFLQTAALALEAQKNKSSNTNAKNGGYSNAIMDTPLDDIPENSPLAKLLDALSVSESVEEELVKLDNPTIGDVIALSQKTLEQAPLPETQISADSGIDAESESQTGIDVTAIIEDERPESAAPDILKSAFLIDDEKNRPALNNLARILKSIEKLMKDGDAGLIATDLSPQQITDLQEKVESLLTKTEGQLEAEANNTEATEDNAENFAGLVLGLIRLLPPQAKPDFALTGKAVILGDANQNTAPQTIGTKDLATQLNNIISGSDDAAEGSWKFSDLGDFEDFESFLQNMKNEKSGKGISIDGLLHNKHGNDNQVKAQVALTSVLQNWPLGNSGSLNAPADYSPEAQQQMGVANGQSHYNPLSAMTSVVTQSHASSQPHPGTQFVAATMQKGAASGEAKNIRIQLDPPELGRVEIKMSFGKDNSVKALLTAEKPETFMMLQRDAQLLERALQDAGLETDSSSLSFELAQDGQEFNQDGRHDGSRNKAQGKGGNGDGTEEVIETTMTWQVDPESGHIRYNILA